MTQAIGEYGLIDPAMMVYQRSAYIEMLRQNVSAVIQMYPKRIIMFTGLNDCSFYEGEVEKFISDYRDMVQDIKKELPDINVVVCSLLPPNDILKASRNDLAASGEFDGALQQLCETENYQYIDTKWMVRQSLYLEDGIHFNSSFYTVYMRYLYSALNIFME